MDLQTKKMILMGAGITCLLLAYYGSQDVSKNFTDLLMLGAGAFHSLNFAINLAK